MKKIKILILGALAAMTILAPFSSRAEESGSGHYMPGAYASFVDALPRKPGVAIANFFSYYSGSADIGIFGGLITAGLDATAYADTAVALYRTPLTLLGGYYCVGVAVPYVWMEVKGEVQRPSIGGGIVRQSKRDTANGFGDITVYPFMLGWTSLGGDLKYDVRLGIYVPTGDYKTGALANLGKNFWTFEPAVTLSYMSSKIGLELSAFAGIDLNTKNEDIDYRTGDQFHLDITVAQHLPILGGIAGLGVNGFYYQQIEGDSGSYALLGDFEGRTVGLGPVLSYVTKVLNHDFVAELKWLREVDVNHRIEGDYVWFKLAMQF